MAFEDDVKHAISQINGALKTQDLERYYISVIPVNVRADPRVTAAYNIKKRELLPEQMRQGLDNTRDQISGKNVTVPENLKRAMENYKPTDEPLPSLSEPNWNYEGARWLERNGYWKPSGKFSNPQYEDFHRAALSNPSRVNEILEYGNKYMGQKALAPIALQNTITSLGATTAATQPGAGIPQFNHGTGRVVPKALLENTKAGLENSPSFKPSQPIFNPPNLPKPDGSYGAPPFQYPFWSALLSSNIGNEIGAQGKAPEKETSSTQSETTNKEERVVPEASYEQLVDAMLGAIKYCGLIEQNKVKGDLTIAESRMSSLVNQVSSDKENWNKMLSTPEARKAWNKKLDAIEEALK